MTFRFLVARTSGLSRPSRPAAAAGRTLAKWRGSRSLGSTSAVGIILGGHDYITFMDVATHHFSNAAIGQACANEAGLYGLAVGEYPNLLCLSALATLALC